MLIYGNDEIWGGIPPAEFARLVADVDAFQQGLRDSGEFVAAEGLGSRPVTVRRAGGEPVVTDGPYLEVKEFVGSYFLVDVADEARALEIARAYPGVRHGGGLEMWPVMRHGGAAGDG